MRVWIHSEKQYGRFGAERWSMEYYQLTPNGQRRMDADPDYEWQDRDIECISSAFTTKEAAIEAASAAADSFFGVAQVQREVVDWLSESDGVADWEPAGDAVEVEPKAVNT